MNLKRVCVVTGTRAEYGLLYPILQKIKCSNVLKLQLIASTMHLSNEFGLTYKQIEEDGFSIDDKIENLLSADSKSAIAKSTGLAIILLSESFNRLQPDVVLILGDRYETHAVATTAMIMNIPIAHIHGGEITQGAVDEQIRHSITKMSQYHFTSTDIYRKRVIQMGENPDLVFNSGAPGIDNIIDFEFLGKAELEKVLNWKFGEKSILFTYHPVTLGNSDVLKDIQRITKALEESGANVLLTYANADDSGRIINQYLESFCQKNPKKYKIEKSLGQLKYLSTMKYIDILVGNTSSGIIEAASFQKPVVNIGDRQKGRLQSDNIINVEVDELLPSINKAFSMECSDVKNIYGDGKASKYIVDTLEKVELTCIKQFIDKED